MMLLSTVVSLSLICLLPTVHPLASVLVSSPFDNFRIECPQSSGAQRLAIRMVESQGQKRQDTVFVLSCQHIVELYPWIEVPQEIADQEREDCRYTQQFDILLDQKLDLTCKQREYLAGIARLADTRIQLECCRMRTRTETSCVQLEYDKPLGSGARIEIEYQAKLINAISIDGNTIRVRFCDLSPRPIVDIVEDLTKATTTTTRQTTTTTAQPTTTLGWWQQTTQFVWSNNAEEIPVHPILNHPKLRKKYQWQHSDAHLNTIGPIGATQQPTTTSTLAPPQPLQQTIQTEKQHHHLRPAAADEEYAADELVVPIDEILHVDEIGIAPPQLHGPTFVPSPIPFSQPAQPAQQIIFAQPLLPLAPPLQWQFGQNATTIMQFDEKQQPQQQHQPVPAAQPQQQHQENVGQQRQHVLATQQQEQNDEQETQQDGNKHTHEDQAVPVAQQQHEYSQKFDAQAVQQQQPRHEHKRGETLQNMSTIIQNVSGFMYLHQAVPATQPRQLKNAKSATQHPQIGGVTLSRTQMQGQRQMEQENVDDPFHHGQAVTATQPPSPQRETENGENKLEMQKLVENVSTGKNDEKNSNEKVNDVQSDEKKSTEEDEDDSESAEQSDQQKVPNLNRTDQNVEGKQQEQQQSKDEQQVVEQRSDQKGDQNNIDHQEQVGEQHRSKNENEADQHNESDQKNDQKINDQPNKQAVEQRSDDAQIVDQAHQRSDQELEKMANNGQKEDGQQQQSNADQQVVRHPKEKNDQKIDQNVTNRHEQAVEQRSDEEQMEEEAKKQRTDQKDENKLEKNDQIDQAVQQHSADQKQQIYKEGDQAVNDHLEQAVQQPSAAQHVNDVEQQQSQQTTTTDVQDVQQQQQQQREQQQQQQHATMITVKPFVTNGNSAQRVQAVQEAQNGGDDMQQQHNRNDLSFHVMKALPTRHGSKLSMRPSTLLIRRKGLRELTVTLLPPKVGQPIGARISADRERQMAEIAIQERVDSIRKIEKGIQLDTNTEAPLPQWVIPLMQGKMVTLNATVADGNNNLQNFTNFGEKIRKNQTAENQKTTVDEQHQTEQQHVQAVQEPTKEQQLNTEQQQTEKQQHNDDKGGELQQQTRQQVQAVQEQSVDEQPLYKHQQTTQQQVQAVRPQQSVDAEETDAQKHRQQVQPVQQQQAQSAKDERQQLQQRVQAVQQQSVGEQTNEKHKNQQKQRVQAVQTQQSVDAEETDAQKHKQQVQPVQQQQAQSAKDERQQLQQRVQAVQQQSVGEQTNEEHQQQHEQNSGEKNRNKDQMFKILFGEPSAKPAVIQKQPKKKDKDDSKLPFHVVHSLLWPTFQLITDDENGETSDNGGEQQQQQQVGAVQPKTGKNDAKNKEKFVGKNRQKNGNKTETLDNEKEHGGEAVHVEQQQQQFNEEKDDDDDDEAVQQENLVKQQNVQQIHGNPANSSRQEDGAVLVEQQQQQQQTENDENVQTADQKLQKEQNVDEPQNKKQHQNRTVQEVGAHGDQTDDDDDQLHLVMSMSKVIRKSHQRQLNIQQIENGTEQQIQERKNGRMYAQNASSSLVNGPEPFRSGNAVARGVKIGHRNVGTLEFPMREVTHEKNLSNNKKAQEQLNKNSREFAEGMMSAIETHMAETMHGLNINTGNKNSTEKWGRDEESFEKANNITIFTQLANYSNAKNDGNEQPRKSVTTNITTEEQQQDEATAADNADDNHDKSDKSSGQSESVETQNGRTLRQIRIDAASRRNKRKLIMLRDDVGEAPKRRKNDSKKRHGRKKNLKNVASLQIIHHQPLTTEDIFGTGAVNLPRSDNANEPAKELSEEAIFDEELPPAPGDLPSFDAFPSPPPPSSSSQRRNNVQQIGGTQLAQLPPDYGKSPIKNSSKNSTTKTMKILPTTTTKELPSVVDDEHDHTTAEETNEEPRTERQRTTTTTTTTTSDVPRQPSSAWSGGRRVPSLTRKRQFERSQQSHVAHDDEEQHYVPPRRVFPSRHGQLVATALIGNGQIGGGGGVLPDEETDASPFDGERAEHLWHPKQEQRRRLAATSAEAEDDEQQQPTTSSSSSSSSRTTTAEEEESTAAEQISATTVTANNRRQNKIERTIENRFEAKSPFEKEIRRKPIVDVSFPKQQSIGDDEENRSNEKLDEGEKAPPPSKDRDSIQIIQKDGQPLYLPPYNRPMLMPTADERQFGDIMPSIGETNDFRTEQKDVEQSLVPMSSSNSMAAKSVPDLVEKQFEFLENSAAPVTMTTTSTPSSTFEESSATMVEIVTTTSTEEKAQRRQRVRSNRRKMSSGSSSTPSTTTKPTTSTSPSSINQDFWVTTRSVTVVEMLPYHHHHHHHQRGTTTPYDIATFYRMPSGNSRHRETVLTFCSKRAAIRDSANMVIACAGEEGDIWTPLRCPPGTDCLPAADSTFRICCPVAVGKR